MAITPAMIHAARRAMVAALGLTSDDRVLVVCDARCGDCPDAFVAAAEASGCHVRTFDLPAIGRPLAALPDGMTAALDGVNVVVNVLDGDTAEVPVRIRWMHAIESRGTIRLGHCPGITEGMMTGGSLDVDYAAMHRRADALMAALAGAARVRITAGSGTNITFDITDRAFVSDLQATVAMGVNLPCGEIYCAPVEHGAQGVIVVDGPVGGDGLPTAPITLEVRDGRVIEVGCDDADWRARVRGYMDTDGGAAVIAELGIGLNPGARLVGRMLEDEKALRTCHIAFGDNDGIPGGKNRSRLHVDYLVHRPTITAIASEGTARPVLDEGEVVV